jgi:hypothetical protein
MSDNQITLPEVTATARAPTASNRPSAPYAKRIISLTFQLGAGSFDGGGANKLTITGLRCHVQLTWANMPSPGQCLIRVYGLTLNQINTLTRAGLQFQVSERDQNFVAVQAGDSIAGLAPIFNGTIYEAYPEFGEMPDSAFVIIANAAAVIQLKPVPPVSFNGPTPVTTALTQIIQPAGLTLEANGVSTVLAYPYFSGTTWTQINRALTAADIFGFHDPVAQKLAIWPKGGSRSGGAILIAPETGMIGYPEFMQNRIRVRTLFSPALHGIGSGTTIQVKSQLSAANGKFNAYQVDYNLASETPGGPWEMLITASLIGVA